LTADSATLAGLVFAVVVLAGAGWSSWSVVVRTTWAALAAVLLAAGAWVATQRRGGIAFLAALLPTVPALVVFLSSAYGDITYGDGDVVWQLGHGAFMLAVTASALSVIAVTSAAVVLIQPWWRRLDQRARGSVLAAAMIVIVGVVAATAATKSSGVTVPGRVLFAIFGVFIVIAFTAFAIALLTGLFANGARGLLLGCAVTLAVYGALVYEVALRAKGTQLPYGEDISGLSPHIATPLGTVVLCVGAVAVAVRALMLSRRTVVTQPATDPMDATPGAPQAAVPEVPTTPVRVRPAGKAWYKRPAIVVRLVLLAVIVIVAVPIAKNVAPIPLGPIAKQSGSGSATIATFNVPNNWDLAWSYDCSKLGTSGNFAITNYDYNGAITGNGNGGAVDLDNQGINQHGNSGQGTEHYHSGGNKYIKVISECAWTLTVTRA